MKKQVKAILKYKDSCDMYVINSYRKKKQYALSFDGVDDYVAIGAAMPAGEMSVIARFRQSNDLINAYIIGVQSSSNPGGRFARAGQFQIVSDLGGADNVYTASEDPYQYNIDKHAAYILQSDRVKLYTNNILNEETFFSDTIQIVLNNMRIGVRPDRDDVYFAGFVWELKIYSKALTEAEITDSYNGIEVTDQLYADWDFKTGSGNTLFDKGPNNFDGTIFGATWVEL